MFYEINFYIYLAILSLFIMYLYVIINKKYYNAMRKYKYCEIFKNAIPIQILSR